MRFLIVLCCSAVLLPGVTAHAASGESAESRFASLLEEQGIQGLGDVARKRPLEWPILTFDKGGKLSVLTFEKLVEYEDQLQNKALVTKETVKLYGNIARMLRKRGGYSNLVLAEAFERILVSRLCAHLIAHPEQHKAVGEMLKQLSFAAFDFPLLEECIRQEEGTPEGTKKLDFGKMKKEQAFEKLLGFIKLTPDKLDMAVMKEAKALSTRNLLKTKKLSLLVWRFAETSMVLSVHLPGMLAYLEKGGTISEIRVDDIRKFETLMGDAVHVYKCEMLGIRRLWPSHLLTMKKDFATLSEESSHFYRIARE